MNLTIQLSDTEYASLQRALRKAANAETINTTGRLELLHLQTLLAEAAVMENR